MIRSRATQGVVETLHANPNRLNQRYQTPPPPSPFKGRREVGRSAQGRDFLDKQKRRGT